MYSLQQNTQMVQSYFLSVSGNLEDLHDNILNYMLFIFNSIQLICIAPHHNIVI